MSTPANTILHAVIYSASMASAPSDFELGMLKGQIFAASCIGPVNLVLLQKATAAVNALRKTPVRPAADPELLAALVTLEAVADESLDMRPTFRHAVSTAHAAIAQRSTVGAA